MFFFLFCFFIGLPPLLFSPLLLITLTSFPPSSLSEFFTSPLPLHSCHTHRISLSFPPEIQNVWAQEGSMCRKGERKMQNITCPRFFPGGFVCVLRARSSSEHMRICYVSFWLKLGTVGLIKDAQTLSVHITFQEAFFFVCVCVSLIMNSRLWENIPNALQLELSQKRQHASTQMFY